MLRTLCELLSVGLQHIGSTLRYNSGMIDNGAAAGKSVVSDTSWFRDSPHYWAEASLSLAYAVACVEVVCQRSDKARILYNRIIEAWSEAGRRRHQRLS